MIKRIRKRLQPHASYYKRQINSVFENTLQNFDTIDGFNILSGGLKYCV